MVSKWTLVIQHPFNSQKWACSSRSLDGVVDGHAHFFCEWNKKEKKKTIRMNSFFWFSLPIFKSDEFKLIEQQGDDDEQPDECVGNQDDADTFEINVSVRQVTKQKKKKKLIKMCLP